MVAHPLHLPASLRSTGMTRLQHDYECSDSCQAEQGVPALTGLLPSLMESSRHSVSNHLSPSRVSDLVLRPGPTASAPVPRSDTPSGAIASWASPFASRLATTTGRNEFT